MQIDHDFPFDPTYGYDLDALMAVTPPADEPADFIPFWRGTYAQAMDVMPRPTLGESRPIADGYEVAEINLDAWGGRRIGGWLVQPIEAKPRLGLVVGHGYGGRGEPSPLPDFGVPAAAIQICKRGFHRSASPDLPNVASQHVLHGIESRETYLHRGCTADIWAAASALLDLHPDLADTLTYSGGSFGGGIGAMALPWDKRFVRSFLDIPSFGHHPIRLTLPCVGSGEAVRQYHAIHPEIESVLPYYDSAIHARHITCPTLVAAAKFDPAVPPPGQFAVYHALQAQRELFVRQYAHFELPVPLRENDPSAAATRWLACAVTEGSTTV